MSQFPAQALAGPPGQAGTGRGPGRTAMLASGMAVLVASLFLASIAPKTLNRQYMALCLVLGVALIALQTVYRSAGYKPVNWLSIEVVFMVMYGLVHFGHALLWLTGLAPIEMDMWRNETIVCYATMMSVACLAAFFLGFNLPPDRYHVPRAPAFLTAPELGRLRSGGKVTIIAGGAIAVGLAIFSPEYLLAGGYGEVEEPWYFAVRIVMRQLVNVGVVMVSLAAIMMTGKWKIGIGTKVVLGVYLVFLLTQGYRTDPAIFLLTLGTVYSEWFKHISFKKLLIAIIGGMFVFAVVGIARYSPRRTVESFLKTAWERSEEITLRRTFVVLGGSMRALYDAVDLIPDRYPYFLGRMKISEMLGVIPYGRKIVPLGRVDLASSSAFLTIMRHGRLGVGVGSTVIADVYVDFGFLGAGCVMFLLGLLCKLVQQKARQTGSLTWNVAHASLVPTVAIMTRNTVLTIIRGVLWPILLLCAAAAILRVRRAAPKGYVYPEHGEEDLEYAGQTAASSVQADRRSSPWP